MTFKHADEILTIIHKFEKLFSTEIQINRPILPTFSFKRFSTILKIDPCFILTSDKKITYFGPESIHLGKILQGKSVNISIQVFNSTGQKSNTFLNSDQITESNNIISIPLTIDQHFKSYEFFPENKMNISFDPLNDIQISFTCSHPLSFYNQEIEGSLIQSINSKILLQESYDFIPFKNCPDRFKGQIISNSHSHYQIKSDSLLFIENVMELSTIVIEWSIPLGTELPKFKLILTDKSTKELIIFQNHYKFTLQIPKGCFLEGILKIEWESMVIPLYIRSSKILIRIFDSNIIQLKKFLKIQHFFFFPHFNQNVNLLHFSILQSIQISLDYGFVKAFQL